ncbi:MULTISPECIES: hypothetical protein [unclassified Pseudoalteromonas]|uniref:hypothetical protein n=1 Tax=unclassified Pseudoalteromonas TaxID=194690 RepID=UPI0020979829|nr:hypothetical protein [Pseudoalteromonas sp. XMcav2-N]MCO7189763.1 hypothetical protein [Pseudoalteromonas sp. XMcav2-N]
MKKHILPLLSLVASAMGVQAADTPTKVVSQNFDNGYVGLFVADGTLSQFETSALNPISGQQSLAMTSEGHYRVGTEMLLMRTFSQTSTLSVSFDLSTPFTDEAQKTPYALAQCVFEIEYADGNTYQSYVSRNDDIPTYKDSVYSHDCHMTVPEGKSVFKVTWFLESYAAPGETVYLDNLELKLFEGTHQQNAAVELFREGREFSAWTDEQISTYFSNAPILEQMNGTASLRLAQTSNGSYKTRFVLPEPEFSHTYPEYVIYQASITNPGSQPVSAQLYASASYQKQFRGGEHSAAFAPSYYIAPNSTALVPVIVDLGKDGLTTDITSTELRIESDGVVLLNSLRLHSGTSLSDGLVTIATSGFEADAGGFETSTPQDVTLVNQSQQVISGEQSLGFEMSPWRQAGFTHYFGWGNQYYADKVYTQLAVQLQEAEKDTPVRVCTDVYYMGGSKDSNCEERILGVGSFALHDVFPVDSTKALYRILVRVRAYGNVSIKGEMDNFVLGYWPAIPPQ